ncbi:hypothetical protein Bbelb_300160 [Branchiostoma belcheri]|nr:hypothetical protein Bbelb_300160 [Branchiostoma belcheri]
MPVTQTLVVGLLSVLWILHAQPSGALPVQGKAGGIGTDIRVSTPPGKPDPKTSDQFSVNDTSDSVVSGKQHRSYRNDDGPKTGLIAGVTASGAVVFFIVIPCLIWCLCPKYLLCYCFILRCCCAEDLDVEGC